MATVGEGGVLVRCSFCGKAQTQVKKIVAGPGVYICNECLALCDEIIANEVAMASTRQEAVERSSAGPGVAEPVFERFTDQARRVLVLAQEEVRLLNHSYIGTEHILLGLIGAREGLAAKVLESLDISLESVRAKVEERIEPAGSAPTESPPFTPRAKMVLELSIREALHLGHNYIGTEHMLLGLLREGEGVAAEVLVGLGTDLSRVRQQVIQLLQEESATVGFSREVMHPGTGHTELPMSVGDSWTVQVVRAGRRPADFAVSYGRLASLLYRLGTEVDDSRIDVASVETNEGPGIRLIVRHEPADDPTTPSGDEGEDASGTESPA